MTTVEHSRKLIANYYEICGLLSRAIVELITAASTEEAIVHAGACTRLSKGVDQALLDLREWFSDAKMIGDDRFFTYLVEPQLNDPS